MKRRNEIRTGLLTLAGSILIAGCAVHKGGGKTVSASATAQSLDAFSSTVYTWGKTQGCVNCHDSAVNPLWMHPDVSIAYSFARPLLLVTNPPASRFATYAGNNHCNNPICAGTANVAVVQDLLTQWATVEMGQGAGVTTGTNGTPLANPAYVTAAMPVPSPLPLLNASAPAVIRFDLSQLTPPVPALAGAVLEIQIRSYSTGVDEYKIYSPRIVGNSVPVNVAGLHVYVRPATGTGLGIEDPSQGVAWSTVSVNLVPTSLPAPLPTGPMGVGEILSQFALAVAAQSAADVITIGIAEVH